MDVKCDNERVTADAITTLPERFMEKQPTEPEERQDEPPGQEEGSLAISSSNDEAQLSNTRIAILTFALCLGVLFISLDVLILATAIPTITSGFHSLEDVGWYGSSYLLTQTAFQPFFGKIYDYFDIKWTILSGVIIFEIGSVLCATANSSALLIFGRAVAGTGAAALYSGGMNIMATLIPLRKRAPFLALISSMSGIANIAAPPLGGVLTERLNWRWCFWINLPAGGVVFIILLVYLKRTSPKPDLSLKRRVAELDLIGVTLLLSGMTAFLLAVGWGGDRYPWSDKKVWVCLLVFGILMVLFCMLQGKRGSRAIIPPKLLLKQRTILSSALVSLLLSMGYHIHSYYLPIYFQAVKGSNAEGSGVQLLPYQISNTSTTIVTGILVSIVGWFAPFMWVGAIIFTVGSGLLYTLNVSTNTATWAGYQILAGIGLGASFNIPFIAAQVVTSKTDMSSANALMIFFHSAGGMLGVPIGQNIFITTLRRALTVMNPDTNPELIIDVGATALRDVVPEDKLLAVLDAYSTSVTKPFILTIATAGAAVLCSLLVEWKSVKETSTPADQSA